MNGIQSFLYTVAIALCVFSAGILRDKQGRTGRSFAWFTTFLIIETLGFVFELLMIHPAAPLKALWLGLRMGTSLLIAPCLWLAVKESVEGVRPRLSCLGGKHRIAILAGLALLLPLIESTHTGLDYYNPAQPTSPLHSRVIHATMLGCIAIFAVQVPYYLGRCRRLLLASADAQTWRQIPLVVVFTAWALGLLRTVQCATHAPRELTLLFALTEVGVTVGAMYLIVRRVSLPERDQPAGVEEAAQLAEPLSAASTTNLDIAPSVPLTWAAEPSSATLTPTPSPEQPKLLIRPEPPALQVSDPVAAPEAKYARSHLDAATRERIKRKLEAALATESVSSDSLLNLRSLSRSINEKAHYVSQVINQDLHTNFYELVNRHRIERARQLLVGTPDQTVLEIALAVGFNSKSTFNTAFRQHTAMTPTDYRAAVLASKQQASN